MKVRFEENNEFKAQDPLVLVQAQSLTDQAKEVVDYLEQFAFSSRQVIPIKTEDHLLMVKIDDIILVDVEQTRLTIFTVDGIYTTKETLARFQNRVNRRSFVQISRHGVLNIDHLQSLSDSFSGSMTAKLSKNIKASVSRKYVKSLMTYLGI